MQSSGGGGGSSLNSAGVAQLRLTFYRATRTHPTRRSFVTGGGSDTMNHDVTPLQACFLKYLLIYKKHCMHYVQLPRCQSCVINVKIAVYLQLIATKWHIENAKLINGD